MTLWCHDCGRALTNELLNERGTCSEHGLVWGDTTEPILVVYGDLSVMGVHLRDESGYTVYMAETGIEHATRTETVDIRHWSDLTKEWR